MKDIEPYQYEDIDADLFDQVLKEQGMVFVKVLSFHGRAYIKLVDRAMRIEHWERCKGNKLKRYIWLIQAIMALPIITIFHTKLSELDGFRIMSKVRCTHERQQNGSYVFIFS